MLGSVLSRRLVAVADAGRLGTMLLAPVAMTRPSRPNGREATFDRLTADEVLPGGETDGRDWGCASVPSGL